MGKYDRALCVFLLCAVNRTTSLRQQSIIISIDYYRSAVCGFRRRVGGRPTVITRNSHTPRNLAAFWPLLATPKGRCDTTQLNPPLETLSPAPHHTKETALPPGCLENRNRFKPLSLGLWLHLQFKRASKVSPKSIAPNFRRSKLVAVCLKAWLE